MSVNAIPSARLAVVVPTQAAESQPMSGPNPEASEPKRTFSGKLGEPALEHPGELRGRMDEVHDREVQVDVRLPEHRAGVRRVDPASVHDDEVRSAQRRVVERRLEEQGVAARHP